jgi:hypothetical protein
MWPKSLILDHEPKTIAFPPRSLRARRRLYVGLSLAASAAESPAGGQDAQRPKGAGTFAPDMTSATPGQKVDALRLILREPNPDKRLGNWLLMMDSLGAEDNPRVFKLIREGDVDGRWYGKELSIKTPKSTTRWRNFTPKRSRGCHGLARDYRAALRGPLAITAPAQPVFHFIPPLAAPAPEASWSDSASL